MIEENRTKALLLNVPLENDYKNTLYFTSKTAQENYFKSRMVRTYNDFSYQRKDEPVRVDTVDSNGLVSLYDDLINSGVNYIMYQNTAYSDKWFYGFITDIKHVSDGVAEVYIETDVLQTWLFDYSVKPSFIEREHVSDDTVGKHTIPENLNIGQIICDKTQNDETFYTASNYFWAIVSCNYDPSDDKRYAGVGSYAKYPQGSVWFAFLIEPTAEAGYNALSDFIYEVTKDGHAEDIQSIFVVPYQFIDSAHVDATNHMLKGANQVNEETKFSKSAFRQFSDYEPRNNKLFCYPYSFMRVTNNLGSYNDYKIEDFSLDEEPDYQDDMIFRVQGIPCLGCSIRLVPQKYQGIHLNQDEGLTAGKYPTLSWASDAFTNWLTQNAINLSVGAISSVAGAGVSIATGNVLGGIASVGQMANMIGTMAQASMLPNTTQGNANAGDIMFIMNQILFKYQHMRAKKEYLQVIDDYFNMFGYKINRVKKPNKAHRSRFWYTKTIDVNIDGAIPNNDMQKIKDCYNKGITFWRNAAEIQNYALDNAISITDGAITD